MTERRDDDEIRSAVAAIEREYEDRRSRIAGRGWWTLYRELRRLEPDEVVAYIDAPELRHAFIESMWRIHGATPGKVVMLGSGDTDDPEWLPQKIHAWLQSQVRPDEGASAIAAQAAARARRDGWPRAAGSRAGDGAPDSPGRFIRAAIDSYEVWREGYADAAAARLYSLLRDSDPEVVAEAVSDPLLRYELEKFLEELHGDSPAYDYVPPGQSTADPVWLPVRVHTWLAARRGKEGR